MAYTIDRYPCQDSPRLGAMILHPEPESVPRARRWFRKFIAPYSPACSIDDCTLMISELVTNAIRYGKSDDPWLVRVEWFAREPRSASRCTTRVSRRMYGCGTRKRTTLTGGGCFWSTPSPTPGIPGPATSAGRSSPSWSLMPGRRDGIAHLFYCHAKTAASLVDQLTWPISTGGVHGV